MAKPAFSQNVLQSLHSGRMSNSGGLTSNANSGRRRLGAAPLLPRKRPPLDPRAVPGHVIEHPDSDSSSASTQRRRRCRWLISPSNREPVAEPPHRTSAQTLAQLPRLPLDPDLVEPVPKQLATNFTTSDSNGPMPTTPVCSVSIYLAT
jgi:hypothetical protein